jgi:eukaryotic translation initiation factor 2-alpha kinase 4
VKCCKPSERTCLTLFAVVDLVLNRISDDLRPAVIEIITQSKSSLSQKRALLLKKGLLRSTADELEILGDAGEQGKSILCSSSDGFTDDDVDELFARLEKLSPNLATLISPAVDEIKQTIQFANIAGFNRPIFFCPLMLGSHHALFNDGVRFEVVRRSKRLDILAAGGR